MTFQDTLDVLSSDFQMHSVVGPPAISTDLCSKTQGLFFACGG